ncbi:max dimerization protein 1-like [Amphibalanus amphitrite]|uniref:max dimerization protein 1-like n=1 Tax=Amphibalanus amphitrite TaxID=1232801 RepID=UPI001C90B3CD|nr:max dimerization protein 1-like [Amphibalanus amphitrite]
MSIEALIEAAEYLERREREAEHGYASTVPIIIESSKHVTKRHMKSRKGAGSRSTHNELEKNRRAHLRVCLERLRDQVPPGPDASRHTTLGLLTRARDYIRSLEDKDRMNHRYKQQLRRQQRYLTSQLEALDRRRRAELAAATAAKPRAASSNSLSSSGYSASELSESADSPDSDGCESANGAVAASGVDATRIAFNTLDFLGIGGMHVQANCEPTQA